MEIGRWNICSGDEPDQIGKGEGSAGDSDHHYIPGLPIERPMTLSLRRMVFVRACLRPGTYHVLVLTELQQICRAGAQGDGSLLNALRRKCYMWTLQYTHRGTLP